MEPLDKKKRYDKEFVGTQDPDEPTFTISKYWSEASGQWLVQLTTEYNSRATVVFLNEGDVMSMLQGLLGIES